MDYCTGWFEGWWAHCCSAHDDGYLAQAGQVQPDVSLLTCVASSLPDVEWANLLAWLSVLIAMVMHVGVRVFGGFYYRRAGKEKGKEKAED